MSEDILQSVRWHWDALVDTKTDDLNFDDGEYSEQDEEEGGTEPHQPHQQEQAAQWDTQREWNDHYL